MSNAYLSDEHECHKKYILEIPHTKEYNPRDLYKATHDDDERVPRALVEISLEYLTYV